MTKLLFGSWHLLSSNILNNETKHEIISASLRIKRKIPYRILVHEWHIIFFTWVHQKKLICFMKNTRIIVLYVIVCTFSSCRTIALRGIWVDKPPMVHQSRISRRATVLQLAPFPARSKVECQWTQRFVYIWFCAKGHGCMHLILGRVNKTSTKNIVNCGSQGHGGLPHSALCVLGGVLLGVWGWGAGGGLDCANAATVINWSWRRFIIC